MSETKFPPDNEGKNQGENKEKIFDDLDISGLPQDSGPVAGEQAEERSDNTGKDAQPEPETVEISKSKVLFMKRMLENMKETNDKMMDLLAAFVSPEEESKISTAQISEYINTEDKSQEDSDSGGRVIEGVFDGENMIGPDGKQYSVPANYASKSKLVEGDILKLTITPNGTFVYKQIGPIERRRVVGTLEQTPNGNYMVNSDGKKWQVLVASVTYFKGEAGDEAVILVPKRGESRWAAVENVVKQTG